MLVRKEWWVLAVAAIAAGCTGLDTEGGGSPLGYRWDDPAVGATGRWQGQQSFESAGPWMHIWGPWLRAMNTAETTTDAKRVIQESDIFAFEGNTLFVLNPYRGLFSIDVTNPDRPVVVGRAPIMGSPKDMIVRGGQAFVLMNDWFEWRENDKFHGSQVLVVDVTRPSAPVVAGQFPVAGNIEDSRLVGDVLYVVSTTWTNQGETHLLSIDVSDPARIAEVDRESFAGTGHVIHVTEEYVFAALYDWSVAGSGGRIRAIDISDPRGSMALAGEVAVEGTIQDRFMLDFADDHLRVVSHDWQDRGHIYVDTFDVTRAMAHKGHLDLGGIGQLTATRFAEDRVYLVHMQRVDPLDVVDLANPASPIRLSSLEIPGWLERLEVRGNTVVGIGFDAPNGPVPIACDGYTYSPLSSGRKLAVALFDATDPAATCEAARVRFGEGDWAWSNAFWDDKSLRLIDDEGLLLVPFNAWLQDGSVNAVQLVDVDTDALTLAVRGRVDSLANVDRSFVRAERLMAFGSQELLVADIEDRDAPAVTARLELARDVTAFSPIGNRGYAVQLVSAPNGNYEQSELRVVRTSKPDAEAHELVSRVDVGAAAGELYVNGSIATVVSRRWTDEGSKVRIATFEVTTRGQIRAKGQIELAGGHGSFGFGPWFRRQNITDVLRVRSNLFVVSNPTEEGLKLSFVSISNASNPRVTQEYVRPNDASTVYDLRAWWNDLYVVTYAPVVGGEEPAPLEGEFAITTEETTEGAAALTARSSILPPFRPRAERVRYAVSRVTFSNSGRATVGEPINVPGRLVDVSRDNRTWTLLDSRWIEGTELGQTQDKAVFTVRVDHNRRTATLLDGIDVEEGVEDVKVRGNAAYYTTWDDTSWMGPIDPLPLDADETTDGEVVLPAPQEPHFRLVILDVADPARIREASRTAVDEDGSAGNLLDVREVDGTRYAFLGMGYGGVSVYDVTSSRAPVLDQFVRTLGWFSNIVISPDQSAAYLASGLHGVQTIVLGD